MVAVLETDNRKGSPSTHGVVVGPRAVGRRMPTGSLKLLDRLRKVLWSRYCHRSSDIGKQVWCPPEFLALK